MSDIRGNVHEHWPPQRRSTLEMDVAGMNIGVNGWKTLAFKAMREKLLFSRKRVKKLLFPRQQEEKLLFSRQQGKYI